MVQHMKDSPDVVAPRKLSTLIRVLTEAEDDIDEDIRALEEALAKYEKEEEDALKKVMEAAKKVNETSAKIKGVSKEKADFAKEDHEEAEKELKDAKDDAE